MVKVYGRIAHCQLGHFPEGGCSLVKKLMKIRKIGRESQCSDMRIPPFFHYNMAPAVMTRAVLIVFGKNTRRVTARWCAAPAKGGRPLSGNT